MRVLISSALIGAALLAAAPLAWPLSPSDDVGPARRAYRSECDHYQPAGYCDCITAGFAQSLPVPELILARLRLRAEHGGRSGQAGLERAAPGLGFTDPESRQAAFAHMDAVETDLQQTCGRP